MIIVTAFIFIVIFFRIFYIQIIWGKNLQEKATDQWTRDLPLTPLRGNIYDANGVLLVTSKTTYTVYVRAKNVTNPHVVAEVLSSVLNLDYSTLLTKVQDKSIGELTIKRQVSPDDIVTIRSHNLDGIYIAEDSSRSYPFGDFLSQVLGFIDIDNIGQAGIELIYDKYLKGTKGSLLTQTDLIGKELYGEEVLYLPAINGLNIELTIDFTIQSVLENLLPKIMLAHNAKGVRSLVIDCQTGEILALSCKPSVDLNNLPRDNISELMLGTKNLMITDVYEPGSTFKVLTAAANIEEYNKGNKNAFSPYYVFNNSNYRIVDGGKISCWTTHSSQKHNNQTLSDALNNSCNPCFTDMALSLGKDIMYSYLEAFGYGSILGVDLPGEQSGLLLNKADVTRGDLARIGFGQAIAVTPLQLAYATAAAINGGKLMTPYIVKAIVDDDNNLVKKFYPTQKSQPISKKTSSMLAEMLEGVVEKGSGKLAYIEGYEVGGKTGTAQKYENGAIARGKNVSSFVGFFPASDPKYLCLMIVDEPEGITYGSQVAAPYVKMIFEQIIAYKNIKPLS